MKNNYLHTMVELIKLKFKFLLKNEYYLIILVFIINFEQNKYTIQKFNEYNS